MLSGLINNTYVVSLKEDQLRREHVKVHFKQNAIDEYQFVDAVSYSSDKVVDAYQSGKVKLYPNCFRCDGAQCECENNILIPQQVANWLSFQKVWELVAATQGWSLICEDDVYFYPGAVKNLSTFLMNNISNHGEVPCLVRLGHSGMPTDCIYSEAVKFETSDDIVMSNVAYVINAPMARLLLAELQQFTTTSDIWLHKHIASLDNVYAITSQPLMATDLSYNKDYAKFVSRIHPKGIDSEDEKKRLSHKKKVYDEAEYQLLLVEWLGTKEVANDALTYSIFNELAGKQKKLVKSFSPNQPVREYFGQLDQSLDEEYGFSRSFAKWESIDSQGHPIPWMTYSAVHYLKSLDLDDTRVFEWGCGNSSLFFAQYAKYVVSIESNPEWFSYVDAQKASNQKVYLKNAEDYCRCIEEQEGLFDLIVVDGDIYRRLECIFYAINKLAPGGILLVDNSDWLVHSAKFLRDRGFTQIDFSGPGPINTYLWCTSIFFKHYIGLPTKENYIPGNLETGLKNQRDTSLSMVSKKVSTDGNNHFLKTNYSYMKEKLLPPDADIYASQEGEDILLKRLLKWYYRKPGFFVDVGAHDPIRFSNTYHYYLKGWRGINIDPLPGMMKRFNEFRPEDVNLEIGVADEQSVLEYFVFKEPAFNTFDRNSVEYALSRTELIDKINIVVKPLELILEEHFNNEVIFTFLSVDVEGLELSVLESNNWEKYRPKIILVEALTENALTELTYFLSLQRYTRVASTKNSYFFCENDFWSEVR